MMRDADSVSGAWVTLDIALCGVLAGEFFTRSGLRWDRRHYLRTHPFDFIAIVPALVLVQHNVVGENVWGWIVLIARFTRVVDRALGDGFVERKLLALMEGFEEEVADRVTLRMLTGLQESLDRGSLGEAVAKALVRNKRAVLDRVHASHPQDGVAAGVARLSGLEAMAVRAEEKAYDAVVEIMESKEIDRVIRDAMSAAIADVRKGLGGRSWRERLTEDAGTPSSVSRQGGASPGEHIEQMKT